MLRAAARTHPGRVRATNEDVPLIDAARGVFGVIDGIGGHAGGEVAAAMAKEVIEQRLARSFGTPAERVLEAIAIANNTIFRRATDCTELSGMACVITLAIVSVSEGTLTIGHVGDTRLYLLRGGGIRKLTRDHSPVGEREDAGELSEAEAMRHPHRNEVFRDVGTMFRDKDEQEFVDVLEEPIENDAAILLCSDGLSDMLPAATIAHIVRQHAGDPEQVVETLVAAANDAGGKDNITVVYAEMPLFADAMSRGAADQRLTPTEPPLGADAYQMIGDAGNAGNARNGGNASNAGNAAVARQTAASRHGSASAAASAVRQSAGSRQASRSTSGADGRDAARGSLLGRFARAVVASRMTWFAVGALGGVLGAVALTAYIARTQVHGSQTLIVSPEGVSPFTTIMSALAAARPGDVVRVEPGVYREQVEVHDGVDLVARIPGTVTIAGAAGGAATSTTLRPAESVGAAVGDGAANPTGAATAADAANTAGAANAVSAAGSASTPILSVTGSLNVRVAGVRIESATPVDYAVAVAAPAATLELVEMSGQIRHAFALSPASAVTVRGSRIVVTDSLLAVPDDGHATFVNSVLTRSAAAANANPNERGPERRAAADATPALTMSPSAHVVLRGNVFAGFGTRILDTSIGQAQRAELLAGNIIVPTDDFAGVGATGAAGAHNAPAPSSTAAPAPTTASRPRRRATADRQTQTPGTAR